MEETVHQKNTAEITPEIREKIRKAELMLDYITDNGTEVSEELVKSVVNIKYAGRNSDTWSAEKESELFLTYKDLTKIIKPVTVESLDSSRPSDLKTDKISDKFLNKIGKKKRNAASVVSARGYTFATALIMITLMVVQIFFYLGSTRLGSIAECETEMDVKQNRLNELMLVLDKSDDNIAIQTEYDKVYNNYLELDNKRKSNIDLLNPWVKKVRLLALNSSLNTDTIGISSKNIDKANTAVIQEAKSYVWIIGIYVLPLLYGIIGGFTFILREFNEEVKKMTFSKSSNTKYLLRILLGAIAGLSIGLFWGDIENTPQFGLSTLSPMLLAFLGGYCVEYLLQFIERVANSFFKKHDPEKKKEGEKKSVSENE